MANYAKIKNEIVEKVIVADASFFDTFVDTSPGTWIESSTAGIGDTYDVARNVSVPPKPYSSWVLNEGTNIWESPITYPADGTNDKIYNWNEETTNWVEVA
jgi:hypothetical protein